MIKNIKKIFIYLFLPIFIFFTAKVVFAATVNLALTNATVSPTSLLLDQEVTYSFRLSNLQSSGSSTGYTISFPSSIRVLRVTCTTSGTANCGNTTTISGNSLSSTNATISGNTSGNNRLNFTIVGRVTNSGTITNNVSVSTGTGDTDSSSGNNTLAFTNLSVTSQTPFSSCPDNGFYARASGGSTILTSLNVATGVKTTIGTTSFAYNAMAFNQGEGFNYAIRGATNPTVVRIGSNGIAQDLGWLDFNGFTTNTTGSAAEFDRNNRMYMIPNNSKQLYIINMDRTSSNFMKVENSVTLSFSGYTPSSSFNIGDLSINPVDLDGGTPQYIYGTETTQTPGDIIRINPSTGESIRISGVLPSTSFGGALFGASGTMYAVRNDTGQFYGVAFNNDRTQAVVTSIGSTDSGAPFSNTDAARCIDAADPIDVQVTKTTSTSSVQPSQTVNYNIDIVNNGPQPIFGVSLSDIVPAQITGINWSCSASGTSQCGSVSSGSGNSISLDSGFLTVGSANKITISVSGISSGSIGTFTNTAIISAPSYYTESNSSNNTSSVDVTIYEPKDFGDAPSSYSTVLTNHNVIASLKMGTNSTDYESVGPSNGTGIEDDNTGVDDEDSISLFSTLSTTSSSYSVTVNNITNSTGSSANLRGWIDFDGNGTFDDDEASDLNTANVPNGTNNANIVLTWSSIPSGTISGTFYARFRLTTNSLSVSDDIGIKSNGEIEDYPITITAPLDYGDAPNSYGTLFSSNGARHSINGSVYLGNLIDSESDGYPNANATGDNLNNLNDEDGVIFNPYIYTGLLHMGQTNTVQINASVNGFVSMWIDYNNDGDFFDSGEQVLNDSSVNTGNNFKSFTIPNNLDYEFKYVRVRYSTTSGISNTPVGLANDGEVEDYRIYLASYPHDCSTYAFISGNVGNGSFEDTPTVTTYIQDDENNIPYWNTTAIGNLIEIWKTGFNGVPAHTFNQFAELNADEVSALYQDVITTPGSTVYITVAHRGRSGIDVASVKAGDPNGTLTTLGNMTDGTTAWGEYTFSYVVPDGQTVTRLQFEAVSSTGGATYGNFIDSVTAFSTTPCSIPKDYGDAPDTYKTLNSSGGAKNTIDYRIKLGTNIPDIDSDGQPSTNADGDDSNGTDDEDGVSSFAPISISETTYSVTINASNTTSLSANVRGWIDFDSNGIFDDDEVSTNSVVSAGSNSTNVTLTWSNINGTGPNIVAGNTYARFRISNDTLSSTSDIGDLTNGETEDYKISILDTADHGDAPITYGIAKHNSPTNTLKMGTNSGDNDPGSQYSSNADGDDLNATDDEDGVSSLSTLFVTSTSYSVSVTVTNTTGNLGRLMGWIDFNRNGTFDSGESASTTVNSGTTNGTAVLNWSSLSNLVSGPSYLRLRFTTNSLANTDSTGTKTNGEVEDYLLPIVSIKNISGTVFEDINYGGGSGRNLSVSLGVPIPDVTVELYTVSSGTATYSTFTTTNSSGVYTFTNLNPGNYVVRVVNRTVSSSRTGKCPSPVNTTTCTQIPIQTFRTDATSGTPVDVTNYVGGQNPSLQDPLNATSGATINSTTGVFSSGLSGTAQSITNINLVGSTDINGLDFGFNFDTIVNTNDSGQGSLRQFVINSNALSNTGLAQVGQTSGKEVSIFMIPNGVANAGQNTSYANQLTTYGAGRIVLATALPNITDSNTIIDGRTQTNNVKTSLGAQTNEGQIGSGGVVGVSEVELTKFNKTEIEIHASNIRSIVANTTATNFELRSIALSNTGAIINGNGSLIQDTLVGMASNGDETGATYSNTYCLTVGPNTSNMTVRHNYVKCDNSGIRRDTDGSNMLVEYNEVDRPSAGQSNTYEAFLIIGGGLNDTAQYNLFKNMQGAGSELGYNPNAQVVNLQIKENTYQDNGKNIDGTPSNEPLGIIVRTIGSNSVLKIYRNIIARNGATGILVQNTNRVWITQNSIFENGPAGSLFGSTANLGIDLRTGDIDPNTMFTNINGVTPNNGTISSTEANNGTDYPIITSALLKNGILRVKGYVGTAPDQAPFANSTLEFFKAANDGNNNGQVIQGDGLNVPHGEGKVFVGTCDTTSNGTFDCTFYNIKSIVTGEYLTATATNTNKDTSEFSNLKIVTEDPYLFYPDNFSNALPGAIIYYTHEVVTPRAGNVTLSTTTDKGWTYLFFNDVNGNSLLDSGDTPYSGGANPNLGDIYNLSPSHSVKLIVKVQVPAGTPMGTVDTFNITGTLTPTDTNYESNSITVKDITTVSNVSSGQLKLVKAVSPTGPQKPGTDLTYTITYTNIGSEPLSAVVINDIVPNSTTFVSVSSGGTYDPVTRKVKWSISGSVMPGVTGFVQFVVKIN